MDADTYPKEITRSQAVAVCDALGFDADSVHSISLHAMPNGGYVTVELYRIRDDVRYIAGDRPATLKLAFPIEEDRYTDAD